MNSCYLISIIECSKVINSAVIQRINVVNSDVVFDGLGSLFHF